MNMQAQAYQQYKKVTVETVAPGKLLIMLFDGAIKNIDIAKKAIGEKDYQLAHEQIIKTQDIVLELMSTLNMDYDISKNLYSLYEYMNNRLIEANVEKSVVILDEVRVFMSDLRNTWIEVVNTYRNNPQINNEVKTLQNFNARG